MAIIFVELLVNNLKMEIENMMNEVRYSKFPETGEYVERVDLDTLVRIFVNHRPVYGVSKNNIDEAFSVLAEERQGRPLLTKE